MKMALGHAIGQPPWAKSVRWRGETGVAWVAWVAERRVRPLHGSAQLQSQGTEKRYAEILNVVSGWRALAQKLNIRRSEIDRMSSCFCKAEHGESQIATSS